MGPRVMGMTTSGMVGVDLVAGAGVEVVAGVGVEIDAVVEEVGAGCEVAGGGGDVTEGAASRGVTDAEGRVDEAVGAGDADDC